MLSQQSGNGTHRQDYRSFADMSSAQRSDAMDRMANQVRALTMQVNALTAQSNNQTNYQKFQDAKHDAIAEAFLHFRTMSFITRLRWLVTGR